MVVTRRATIFPTQKLQAVIETFNQVFNDYLASRNCIHSMSQPGHPWENSPMERWWNDFKLIWLTNTLVLNASRARTTRQRSH